MARAPTVRQSGARPSTTKNDAQGEPPVTKARSLRAFPLNVLKFITQLHKVAYDLRGLLESTRSSARQCSTSK
jgi:hypothetical protein